jgi:hypothetical protein
VSTSQQMQFLEAVQAGIVTLAAAYMPAVRVYLKKLPTDRKVDLPAAVVSLPANESEQMLGGFNLTEDIGFPAFVTFLKAGNAALDIESTDDPFSLLREKVILHFHNKNVTTPAENYTCKVEPRQIIDFDAFITRNTYAGALVVRGISRLLRV